VYDGNAILSNIEGLIIFVTKWGRQGGRGRVKGTKVHVEAGTSIVGRHEIQSTRSLLRSPTTTHHSGPSSRLT
jgi:hypothetical protein